MQRTSGGEVEAYLSYFDADLSNLSLNFDSDGWLIYILNGIGHTFPFDYLTDGIINLIVRTVRKRLNSTLASVIDDLTYTQSIPGVDLSIDYHILELLLYSDSFNE